MSTIQFKKVLFNAFIPSYAHADDVGMDLVCVAETKRTWGQNDDVATIMYDTGIAVCPPDGYYTEIVARSSLSKSGWMVANGIGIIDPSYRGSLKVVLVRVVKDAPELTLPFCSTQLVLRKLHKAKVLCVEDLPKTTRGEGAFGSTGSRTNK